MIKVDIISGFLGAGKTTLIKKLIKEAYKGEKLVLIENEFGQIGIDGGFMNEAGIEVTEMNSGCICCSLVGDFGEALKKVALEYDPDRIIIEPSGVGKLSDVIAAVKGANIDGLAVNASSVVIDAGKCKMYMKNFSEFYRNQIEFASAIILSRTSNIKEEKLEECINIVREINAKAPIVTTPWESLDGSAILMAAENATSLEDELKELVHEHKHHHGHHHHDGECECGHHHDHEHHHHDGECECGHHHDHEHHHHDGECECGHHHDHEHHHHDGECECGHHHDHHADEVFDSWGIETASKHSMSFIEDCLDELMTGKYGMILRAKGIVASDNGNWIHFDYVPGEKNVRFGSADINGKLCVIGTGLDKKGLTELFNSRS